MPEIHALKVETNTSGTSAVVRVTGELEMTTVAGLRDAIEDVYACERLILDLSEVEFMDSSGVDAIVRIARRRNRQYLTAVEVVNMRSHISRLFEITGLYTVAGVSTPPPRPCYSGSSC